MNSEEITSLIKELLFQSVLNYSLQLVIIGIITLGLLFISSILYLGLQKIVKHDDVFLDKHFNKKVRHTPFWEFVAFFLSLWLLTTCINKSILITPFYLYFLIIFLIVVYLDEIYRKIPEKPVEKNSLEIEKFKKWKTTEIKIFLYPIIIILTISFLYWFVLLINTPTPNSDFSFPNIINIIMATATIFYASISYYSLHDNRKQLQKQNKNSQKQLDYIEITQIENKILNLRNLRKQLSKILEITMDINDTIDNFNISSSPKELGMVFTTENKSLKKIEKKVSKTLELDMDENLEFNIWIVRYHLKYYYLNSDIEKGLDALKDHVNRLITKTEYNIESVAIDLEVLFKRKKELEKVFYKEYP
ncbi:MAG: hypothetical protein LBU81_06615 [Methanosarcinales archaeon]|jgi:hypothetical protein|nr:hypothetical protein [Methanosarcinales archaeon]